MLAETKYHVGDGWRYRCKHCGFEVGLDHALPPTCPGCGAGGWWGHWTTGGISPNGDWMVDAKDIGKLTSTLPVGLPELCHPTSDTKTHQPAKKMMPLTPPKPQGQRGPKFKATPDAMIRGLVAKRYGAKRIAKELEAQGVRISYRTICRRLEKIPIRRRLQDSLL